MRSVSIVAGERVDRGDLRELCDPADASQVIGEVVTADAAVVEKALDAAVAGQRDWARRSPAERGALLEAAAGLLAAQSETMALRVTLEEGKPLWEARAEVGKAVETLRFYGALGRDLDGRALFGDRADSHARTVPTPVGVCALLTPWNVPVVGPARKVAPALVTGNACVLKPASWTPGPATLLVEILHEAGIPPEVVQVLHGPGHELGERLVSHARVTAVSFTGSTEVGHRMRRTLPPSTRLQAELGGKNPLVVMPDADLELAIELIVRGGLLSTGQMCTATSRVLVHTSVLEKLRGSLLARIDGIRLGPGTAEDTWMGPLVSEQRRTEVEAALLSARKRGLVVEGGERPRGALSNGWFLTSAVVTRLRPDDPIAQDELFGPVLALLPFETLDEAIAIANNTRYGLSASICTSDLDAALAFVDRCEAGVVGVNVPTAGVDLQFAFGGIKDSGSGSKEQGREGLEFFVTRRTIIVAPHSLSTPAEVATSSRSDFPRARA